MNVSWFITGLIVTFLVNIPFCFWRAHAKRISNKFGKSVFVLWRQGGGEAI